MTHRQVFIFPPLNSKINTCIFAFVGKGRISISTLILPPPDMPAIFVNAFLTGSSDANARVVNGGRHGATFQRKVPS